MVEHIQYSKKLLPLEKFLQKQTDTPVVLIQGLGFVGSVMSLVVANAISGDYAVIGVDQDTETGRRTVDALIDRMKK
jgi:hypothetical protein